MDKSTIWVVLVFLVVVVIGVGFYLTNSSTPQTANLEDSTGTGQQTPGGGYATPQPAATTTGGGSGVVVGATTSITTPTPTASVKEFTVSGKAFSFAPSTMTVKKGDTVKITFQNTGGMHDWKIDEFNAATKVIQAGQTDTVTFVADKAGSFEYYCSVGNHRAMGMKGTLTVTE